MLLGVGLAEEASFPLSMVALMDLTVPSACQVESVAANLRSLRVLGLGFREKETTIFGERFNKGF